MPRHGPSMASLLLLLLSCVAPTGAWLAAPRFAPAPQAATRAAAAAAAAPCQSTAAPLRAGAAEGVLFASTAVRRAAPAPQMADGSVQSVSKQVRPPNGCPVPRRCPRCVPAAAAVVAASRRHRHALPVRARSR